MKNNINLDKFYTPNHIVDLCIYEFWTAFKEVTELIEPSAGNGAFSLKLDDCIAYDIEPEHESIIKQDFLKLRLPYKYGRAIIGNPPFGKRNNLALKFYKHAVKMCDMIGFILPISQLNNVDSLYEFDLIKSIDLGKMEYSGIEVHCCFNLYHRPENGKLNKKLNLKSELFSLHRTNRDNFNNTKPDFMFCKRGSVGKEIFEDGKRYGDEYKVVVFDKGNLEFVKNTIINYDWSNYKTHQSSPNISKNDIYRLFSNTNIMKKKVANFKKVYEQQTLFETTN